MALKTALYDQHVACGAKLVEFAGWMMPVMYTSIVEEHQQVRTSVGMFDVSHMGRLKFSGAGATALLNKVCTRQLHEADVGKCRYSLVCNEAGGTLDDVVVTRFDGYWNMVCNASNREKLLAWFAKQSQGLSVKIDDHTADTVMLALQGPRTWELAERILPFELPALKKWQAVASSFMFVPYTLYRSGYTGEDGVEVVIGKGLASLGWKQIVSFEKDGVRPIKPIGLGARDTLRIEAALPLYGHELSETLDPLSAGLGWAVNLDKDFIGAEALRKIAAAGPQRKLVGLKTAGPRIARQGCPVLAGGKPVGEVTSGTFGPTVQANLAMAYVSAEHTAPGTALTVDIRGNAAEATVVELPFYRRPKA